MCTAEDQHHGDPCHNSQSGQEAAYLIVATTEIWQVKVELLSFSEFYEQSRSGDNRQSDQLGIISWILQWKCWTLRKVMGLEN